MNPPGYDGLAWGWLVCAGLFFLMGGVPLLFAAPYLFNAFRGMNGGGYGPARVGPGPFQGGPLASSRSARRFVKMATKIGDRLPTPPSAQGSIGLDETAEAPKRSISTGAATVALLERTKHSVVPAL